MTISTSWIKNTARNILPNRTIVRLYALKAIAAMHKHDWKNNLPVWMALSGLCFSMILFALAVKHAWCGLRNYENLCRQTDLSALARQRDVRLALIESRKNPAPQNAIKHKRHRRGAMMIKQSDSANSDDIESDVIKIPPAPGSLDTDKDGLYDVEEKVLGTDWRRPDTDDDGINDVMELKMGPDPTLWDNISGNTDRGNPTGDGSVQFGTFSYPSSGSRKKWDAQPQRGKRGKKRYAP